MTTLAANPVPAIRPRTHPVVFTLTVAEIILLTLYGVGSGAFALLFGFVSDSCGGYHCDWTVITTGIIIAVFGCAGAALVFVIVTIVRLTRRASLPWLFPLIGAAAVFILFWGSYCIVMFGAHLPLDGSGRPA